MAEFRDDPRAPAEKVVAGSLIDHTGVGKPLSERTLQRERTVESYLRGEAIPRYMQRAAEIERGVRDLRRRLAATHSRTRTEHPDPAAFAAAWAERVARWDVAALNELVRQHNQWYPIERDLPMDPRTGDYVLVHGRSHVREPITPEWILARFPA